MSPQRRDHANAALEQALAAALRETETATVQHDRFRAVLDELRQGVLVLDADGVEVFRNPAAERYRDGAALRRGRRRSARRARLARALRRGLRARAAALRPSPGRGASLGRARSATPSEPLGVAALVADVSEVHRIESVRRDFVANVSHELKTPIGALEVLAETLAAEDDPAVTRPLAERIVKEAERLARIVDDLLDLSLIETQEAPRRTPVPLEVLVDDAVDQLRPPRPRPGSTCRSHPGVTGALVACDRPAGRRARSPTSSTTR